jgi:hypothetical protein
MSAQVHFFGTGLGFVVHHAFADGVGLGSKSYSAWFDASGKLLDAEVCFWVVNSGRRSRPVKRGGAVWRRLASLASRYLPEVAPCAGR